VLPQAGGHITPITAVLAMKSTPIAQPSDLDCAYLAGIIDGEGCITARIERRRRPDGQDQTWLSIAVTVHIVNTDRRLIDWLVDFWPGDVTPLKRMSARHKPAWRFQAAGRSTPVLLADAMPYLMLKCEQANLAMELIRTHRLPGRNGYSPEERASRTDLVKRIQILNRKGPSRDYPPDDPAGV
jgi:hypothetical protein